MIPHQLIGALCIALLCHCDHSNARKYGDRFTSFLSDEIAEDRKAPLQLEEAKRRSETLKGKLWREFKTLTQFDTANQTFHNFVLPRLKFLHSSSSTAFDESEGSLSEADIDVRVTEWRDRVQEHLEEKVEALKNIVRIAETVVANYSTRRPDFDENCKLSYVDVRDEANETDFWDNSNAIHIPIGVINCSGIVQRDISWLGHESLTRAFKDNKVADKAILRQYIAATESAVTRLHPVTPWKLNPADITVDLFDPRGRHWFVRATSCPKDIMFLIDLSGSVAGQTRHLMKMTIMTILTTLTPDDYISATWYNKEVGLVMSKCFDGFIPATTRNKLLLERCLNLLGESFEADFDKALNFTYEEFLKWENMTRVNADRHYGSGCHKCLFVLTDTVQETGQELFDKFGFLNDSLDIRLFGFAMGFNTPDIEALQLLSCRKHGGYFKVDSLEDIKEQSIAYLWNLSRPLAMSKHGLQVESRTVSWTAPYMDAQGEGPMLTLSMPILNKMKDASDDSFIGVAAIDVKLSVLRDLADTLLSGTDSFLFAVDNNGNVLFHPELHVPEVDLQMVRRSACFEATPAKRRSEADKVIFWDTTEEVKMQMGLMDSMFTIDIAELERPTPQMLQLREKMISGGCVDGEEFASDHIQYFSKLLPYARNIDYSYRCRKLPGTPFSLGHAMKRPHSKLTSSVKEGWSFRRRNFTNNSIAWIPSPRVYCKTDLSAVSVEERWIVMAAALLEQNYECADSGRTSRMLLDYDAVEQWLSNTVWAEDYANQSCVAALYWHKDLFDHVFIQTEGGLTAFYPKCTWHMPSIFSKDVFQSGYYQYARLWPQELHFAWASASLAPETKSSLVMFATIHDQRRENVLSVIGTQVPANRIWNWWRLAGNRSNGECWDDYAQRVCYLITRHFTVIGSSSPAVVPSPTLHFGTVEPYLFEYLVNKSSEKIVFTNYQDRCQPGEAKFCPTSDARSRRLLSFIDLVYGMLSGFYGIWSTSFWINLWSLVSIPQPSPVDCRLMGCETKKPRNDEHCIRQYELFSFDPAGSFSPGKYYDDGCGRDLYFEWTKIDSTNLYLIEVHRPPLECRAIRPIIYSVEPSIRSQCDELKERGQLLPRRRYTRRNECVDFHDRENKGFNEDTCAGARHTLRLTFLICGILATVSFRFL